MTQGFFRLYKSYICLYKSNIFSVEAVISFFSYFLAIPSLICIFADTMQRVKHFFIWLSRITHCRGFGIQSPTDYWLVRYVINEHWPYYHYSDVGQKDDWLRRKLGRLYMRLSNWRQPSIVVSDDYRTYFVAGCAKANVVSHAAFDGNKLDLVRFDIASDVNISRIYNKVDEQTVLVVEGIYRNMKLWREIVADERTGICFDLYYCGLVFFDKKRIKQHYIINF